MKQSTTTYTRRVNARRAGIAAGIPSERVAITVYKNGDTVRFGWKETPTAAQPKKVTTGSKAIPPPRTNQMERNGIKRPQAGGICAAVWAWLDMHPGATLKDIRAAATAKGWNANNASCELYAWRKFNGSAHATASK